MNDDHWKSKLSAEEYRILREKGTERAFTGQYNDYKETGVYKCAACGSKLFLSDAKFDSGSGWPSFFVPFSKESIKSHVDYSHGMTRTEVTCANCDGHLGHVFTDGPQPSGLRYCVNSVSLRFDKRSDS